MNLQKARGISREGLDADFAAEEARKSNLILQARLLRDRQSEEAAFKFAQAAEIEECLSAICTAKGLGPKSRLHAFSAASCWAQAGNFYQAIALCEELLAQTDLPERLHKRVLEYAQTLRSRRSQWYACLALEAADISQ